MAMYLGNGNVTFGDGTSQSTSKGVAVAWGRVINSTTLAASYGVSSVSYSGEHYYPNWSVSMGSTNYCVVSMNHNPSTGGYYANVIMNNGTFTASQCDINTNNGTNGVGFAAYK